MKLTRPSLAVQLVPRGRGGGARKHRSLRFSGSVPPSRAYGYTRSICSRCRDARGARCRDRRTGSVRRRAAQILRFTAAGMARPGHRTSVPKQWCPSADRACGLLPKRLDGSRPAAAASRKGRCRLAGRQSAAPRKGRRRPRCPAHLPEPCGRSGSWRSRFSFTSRPTICPSVMCGLTGHRSPLSCFSRRAGATHGGCPA